MAVKNSPREVADVVSQIGAECGLEAMHIILVKDGGRLRASLPATILIPGSTTFVEEVIGLAKPGVPVCRCCSEGRRECSTATRWKRIGSGLACYESCKGKFRGDSAAAKSAAGFGGAAKWMADAQEALSNAYYEISACHECDDQSDMQTGLRSGDAREEGSAQDEKEGPDSEESGSDKDELYDEESEEESPAEGSGGDSEDSMSSERSDDEGLDGESPAEGSGSDSENSSDDIVNDKEEDEDTSFFKWRKQPAGILAVAEPAITLAVAAPAVLLQSC